MVRTLLGICVALLLSAALVASPCVVCFQPPAASAHDCCKKKEAPPKPCGLYFTELTSLDVPVVKMAAPEMAPAVLDFVEAASAIPVPDPAEEVRTPEYAPPAPYLLNSVLRV